MITGFMHGKVDNFLICAKVEGGSWKLYLYFEGWVFMINFENLILIFYIWVLKKLKHTLWKIQIKKKKLTIF